MAGNTDRILDSIADMIKQPKKALCEGADWRRRPRAGGTDVLDYAAPVSQAEVIRGGLQARIRCQSNISEAAVHAQLETYVPAIRSNAHILRVDWRPLSPHTNNAQAPSALKFRTFHDRYYDFGLNRRLGIAGLRQTTTMIARAIPREIGNFNELLAFLGELWNMEGLDRVPPPPWEDRLV